MMTDLQRKGRYCVNCSEKTAAEAGVQVRSSNELDRQDAKEREQLQRMEMLKKTKPTTPDNRRFGMVRKT